MSTIKSQLEYTNETKNLIKQEIIKKGVVVSDADTFRAYPQKIKEIQQGYPPKRDNLLLVTWFDYDGSVIKAKWYGLDASVPLADFPKPPNHERLAFTGWNHSAEDLASIKRHYYIAACVEPKDGNTHIVADIPGSGTNTSIFFNSVETLIDWGDGAPLDVPVRQDSGFFVAKHKYSQRGKYCIKIKDTRTTQSNIAIRLGGTSRTGSTILDFVAYVVEANFSKSIIPANNSNFGFKNFLTTFSENLVENASFSYAASEPGFIGMPRFSSGAAIGMPAHNAQYISYPKSYIYQDFTSKQHLRLRNPLVFGGNITVDLGLQSAKTICVDGAGGKYYREAYNTGNFPKEMVITNVSGINAYNSGNINLILTDEKFIPIDVQAYGSTMTKIFVRDSMLEQYRSDANWSPAKNIIFPISEFLQMKN